MKYALSLFLLLPIFFFSCSKNTPSDKTFNITFASNPSTLDPRRSGDMFSSSIIFMLYQGLTEVQSDGTAAMALASSYTLSLDKKIYTFYLKNAYWSNGQKITAYDFEASWKKILDPTFGSPCTALFYPIKNAEKVAKGLLPPSAVQVHAKDKKTLVVELEAPTSYFLSLISFCSFFPVPAYMD